jgi:hypothetical protein
MAAPAPLPASRHTKDAQHASLGHGLATLGERIIPIEDIIRAKRVTRAKDDIGVTDVFPG